MVTKRMDDEDLFSDSDMGAAPLASPVNRCGDQDYRSFSMGSETELAPEYYDPNRDIGNPRDFSSEVDTMRRHIRQMRSRVWTSPRWISLLDMLVGFCTLFVSIVSPVDVTMSRQAKFGTVFLVGVISNAVFGFDCLVRFNRAYRDETSKGGRWVRNRRKICMRYLKGWFVIDVIAAMPLDLPFILGILDASSSGMAVRLVSLLRLVRCLKVIQVVPIVMNILLTRLAVSNSNAELLKFGIIFVLLTHYLACLWAFVGLNWEPTEGVSGEDEKSWIDAYGMLHYPLHRLYGVAFYVSIVAIFGGVSSVTPQNFVEYVALSVMMLLGGLTWAYILSMLCAIFSKLDPRETEHKNMMDELQYFMEERDFDAAHRTRLRDFFNYTKDFAREGGYSAIFERMSNKLRADTALLMGEAHVQAVWYLRRDKCENGFLCEVSLNLRPAVYEIHETLPIKKLTVITRGLVAQRMRLISQGRVLGIDCLLKDQHSGLRDLDPVMCLSFVHVACISRDTLFNLAAEYPRALQTLGQASRHMTIRSALMLYYRKYVRYNKKLPGKNGIEDIVEAIYDRKLGRKASMGTGKGAAKDMMGHGDSRQMENQLDELKAMVAQLAAAQAKQISSTSTNSRSPSPVSGSLKSRSYDTRSGSKGRSESYSRGGGGGRGSDRRGDFKEQMRQDSRSVKDRPGRSTSGSRTKSHGRDSGGIKLVSSKFRGADAFDA